MIIEKHVLKRRQKHSVFSAEVYIFSRISRILLFRKIKYTRKIFLNGIRENRYTKNNMHVKFWLIQLFLESINNKFFHFLPAFPLILTETLATYPLNQLLFFFGAKINKPEILKNLLFAKISTSKI